MGGKTLKDLLLWPSRVVEQLLADSTMGQRLLKNVQGGLAVRTFYSGIDTPSICLNYIVEALKICGQDIGKGVHVVHGADIKTACQQIMLNSENGPEHVFANIHERLPAKLAHTLASLEERYVQLKELKKSKDSRAPSAVAEIGEGIVQQVMAVMRSLELHKAEIFSEIATSWCQRHGQECPCCRNKTGKSEDFGLSIVIAGSTCVAWSAAGLRMKFMHPSFATFVAMMVEIRATGPDLFVHECTTEFPAELLEVMLGQMYTVTVFPELDPRQLGWPMHRLRQYVVCHKKSSVYMTGTVDGFYKMFARKLGCTGDVFYVAPPEDILKLGQELARKRKMAMPQGAKEVDFNMMLTGCQQSRINDYDKQKPDDKVSWFADLNYNDQCGPRPSENIPVLLTHHMIWSWQAQRPNVPKEGYLMQGLPVYEVDGVPFRNPFAAYLDDGTLKPADVDTTSGNGMTFIVVGTLLAYVLSSTERVSPQNTRRGFSADMGLGAEPSEEELVSSVYSFLSGLQHQQPLTKRRRTSE